MRKQISAAALVLAMSGAGEAKSPALAGEWGGDRAILTIGPDGGQLRQDCAEGSFGPVVVDEKGRFRVTGHYRPDEPGPQAGDAVGTGPSARFEGVVDGATIRLTVTREGAAPQVLTLASGKPVKLIRCL